MVYSRVFGFDPDLKIIGSVSFDEDGKINSIHGDIKNFKDLVNTATKFLCVKRTSTGNAMGKIALRRFNMKYQKQNDDVQRYENELRYRRKLYDIHNTKESETLMNLWNDTVNLIKEAGKKIKVYINEKDLDLSDDSDEKFQKFKKIIDVYHLMSRKFGKGEKPAEAFKHYEFKWNSNEIKNLQNETKDLINFLNDEK